MEIDFGWAGPVGFFLAIFVLYFAVRFTLARGQRVRREKQRREAEEISEKLRREAKQLISDLARKIENYPRVVEVNVMGDHVEGNKYVDSVHIEKSTLEHVVINNNKNSPEFAKAIAEIAIAVENSRNEDAIRDFNSITEILSKRDPAKGAARNLWSKLKGAIPVIKDSVELVSTFEKFLT